EAGAEVVVFGSQGDSAEGFACAGRSDGYVVIVIWCGRQQGGAEDVGDSDEFVGVGGIVSIECDGGGDAVDGGGAVVVDDADDVTAAAGCGFDGRRIALDA